MASCNSWDMNRSIANRKLQTAVRTLAYSASHSALTSPGATSRDMTKPASAIVLGLM